jgi:hypothetical protein
MGLALYFLLRSMNKQLRKVAGEPKWRDGVTKAEGTKAAVTKAAAAKPGQDQEARPDGTGAPEP